jgi:hypothetical protein
VVKIIGGTHIFINLIKPSPSGFIDSAALGLSTPKIIAKKIEINKSTLSTEMKTRKINELIDNTLLESIQNTNKDKPKDEQD